MFSTSNKEHSGSRLLVTAAAFVIVVGGMKAAAPIIVPFLLSVFLALVSAVPQEWLIKKNVPPGLATFIVVVVFLAAFFFVGKIAGSSIDDFISAAPSYQAKFKQDIIKAISVLDEKGINVSKNVVLEYFDPSSAVTFASRILSATTGLLTDAFLIIVVMIFILLEVSSISERLLKASGDDSDARERLSAISSGLRRYLLIKSGISFLTALILWGWLYYLNVSYAQLWGILVFFLNFVPNIGSLLAGIAPLIIGLVEGGLGTGFAVLAGFASVNVVMGNFVEPQYMGKGLGISTLVVFLSLAFWGWVLGPVGMLLSVPLTMVCKISLESTDDLRWVALLLGD